MSLVTEQHSMRNPRAVLHWYDFLCPFCYIGQSRNAVLVQHGFHLVELTFQRFTPKSTRRDLEEIERFICTLFGDSSESVTEPIHST